MFNLQNRKKTILILVIVIVILAAIGGVGWYVWKKHTIQTVYVEGNIHYTQEEICSMVMDGPFGNNSLYLSMKYKNRSVTDMPFLDEMDVKILTPDTIKITVYDPDGSEHHSLALLKDRLPEGVGCSLDGPFWTNLGPGGISKGTGIAGIQAHFGLTPDQTMIFGDYLNDYDMMPLAHFSYAMANAHPDLKAICRYETLSNDDDGVMYILRQLLAGK